ncbi:zinc finger BED domain-containing protein 4-like [Diorhabda sublineata]|uniref:zinc finger BED domain-containing protein 4-like n=1 Tax=Diorhabda sublineata TaxID=1163346 RepID=UPI0024E0CDA0|nr:zinc finger BED domain-containing protein 4-like [Diorhabda sublineata]
MGNLNGTSYDSNSIPGLSHSAETNSTRPDKFATCKIWNKDFSFKTSITNLKRHLLVKHPTVSIRTIKNSPSASTSLQRGRQEDENSALKLEYNSGPSSTSTPIHFSESERSTTSEPYHNITNLSKDTIDRLILDLCIKDYQPFSIVEDSGFNKLIKNLAPGYVLPSRKYLSDTLLTSMYDKCLAELVGKLDSVKSVCITTDNWTSIKNENYIGITVHYIDNQYKLHHNLLECIKFEGQHTALAIAEKLRKTLSSWNLYDNVLIFTTDNAKNICEAVQIELKIKHFGCFAHTLNLCVQHALTASSQSEQELSDDYINNCVHIMIQKIKAIVYNNVKHSPQNNEKLLHAQTLLGKKQPLSLINDVKTRWNSTFYMIQRFLELKEALVMVYANLHVPNTEMLTGKEWRIAQEICYLLRPFEEATREMSGEQYFTASKIIPVSQGLKRVTQTAITEGKVMSIQYVAQILLDQLNTRYNKLEFSGSIASCSFLDPRFKQHIFTDSNALQIVQKDITAWVTENILKKLTQAVSQTTVLQSNIAHTKATAILEIQRYISDTVPDRRIDPLLWWKNNEHIYPNLAELVQIRCCMIATSVPLILQCITFNNLNLFLIMAANMNYNRRQGIAWQNDLYSSLLQAIIKENVAVDENTHQTITDQQLLNLSKAVQMLFAGDGVLSILKIELLRLSKQVKIKVVNIIRQEDFLN